MRKRKGRRGERKLLTYFLSFVSRNGARIEVLWLKNAVAARRQREYFPSGWIRTHSHSNGFFREWPGKKKWFEDCTWNSRSSRHTTITPLTPPLSSNPHSLENIKKEGCRSKMYVRTCITIWWSRSTVNIQMDLSFSTVSIFTYEMTGYGG